MTDNYDILIFHGIFGLWIWLFLLINPIILKKTIWVCWGGDLYNIKNKRDSLKQNISRFFRHKIKLILVRKFKGIVVLNESDLSVLDELYRYGRAKVIPYPLLISDNVLCDENHNHNHNHNHTILLGNSGDSSNGHIQLLEYLSIFKDKEIVIICPLGYGGTEQYIKSVTDLGNSIFGKKFIPYTDMIDQNEYINLLSKCDAAIINHKRQQALFVCYFMLKYGKKLFMSSESPVFFNLKKNGISVYPVELIPSSSWDSFVSVDSISVSKNKDIYHKLYSLETINDLWRKLVNDFL